MPPRVFFTGMFAPQRVNPHIFDFLIKKNFNILLILCTLVESLQESNIYLETQRNLLRKLTSKRLPVSLET